MPLAVNILEALNDNYNYVLECSETAEVAVVDPSGDDPTSSFLRQRGLALNKILITHHHPDHVGGVKGLKKSYGAQVIAPKYDRDRIANIDLEVSDLEQISVGNYQAQVLYIPGHTTGHIAYWFGSENYLFVGDTIFSMGCGRMFEGTAKMMWQSLQRLMQLPDDTQIFCAHEYTLNNAKFALHVDPDNQALKTRVKQCEDLRKAGLPTLPVSLATEKQTNPFLRAGSADEFARLRKLKDDF